MKLQLTLDHGKDFEVLRIVDAMADVVDIIEIGFPQIITFGLGMVKEIRSRHPNLCLCVDAKIFHGGTGVTSRCFDAGANIVTVLSGAPDPVIAKMVEKAHACGGQIMCDMAATPSEVGKRTAEVDELGVDYVMVPSGFRPEYEYELETARRRWGIRPKVRPLDLAAIAKRNLRRAKLAIHTGICEENIRNVVALGPEIILVGHSILIADSDEERVAKARRLERYLPFEG